MLFSGPSFLVGFASGFGTGLFTRELVRGARTGFRPLARSVVRTSMLAVEKLRESLASAGETFEDLVAEARADLSSPGGAEVAPTPEEVADQIAEAAQGNTTTARSKKKKG